MIKLKQIMHRIHSRYLCLLAPLLLLLPALGSGGCGQNQSGSSGEEIAETNDQVNLDRRVALVELQVNDSASLATNLVVDGMLRQAFDSAGILDYVDLRAQQAAIGSDSGVSIVRLVTDLELEGIIVMRVARLGSVVGVDLRMIDPRENRLLFHDRAFSFIRYRDEEGSMLFAPSLYEAINRLVARMAAIPDNERLQVSAEPLVIANVVIGKDSTLGRIATNRSEISHDGVRALGDYARWKFPSFIVFDVESRLRLYETQGLALVEEYKPVGNLERQAMYGVDVPYYLSASIETVENDSIQITTSLYFVDSPASDTLIDSERARFAPTFFENSQVSKHVIAALIEVADILLTRQAERIESDYEARRSSSMNQSK